MTTPSVVPARAADDPGIRALLRRQVMDGQIRLTFEREPDHRHAAGIEGERHHVFVARRRSSGDVVGLASRAVRRAWIGGEPRLVGYLAQLRRLPELKGGHHLLRDGFEACESTRRDDELRVDLTSIVSGNAEARRLLERGLPGLPTYRRLCSFHTLTFETSKGSMPEGVVRGTDHLLPSIVDCLQRNLRRHEFAPVWSADDLRCPERTRDLEPSDFLVDQDGDSVRGCVAVWDQRRFKQVVVRGYRGALGTFRPLINLGLSLTGGPRLPVPGKPLALGFLSHTAVDDDDPDLLLSLVHAARSLAAEKGLSYLSMGLAKRHPLADTVRRATGARVLESLLYLVGPRVEVDAFPMDSRAHPHVEAATL